MAYTTATKTLNAINAALEADQGAKYRQFLEKVIPHIGDAYRGDEENPFRKHLGASMIGRTCDREIWYGFRWAVKPKFKGRMIRLFNRGHLEEARFIALLLTIGVQVYQQDAEGRQFRISDVGGHFGGSGDGVGIGLPDVTPGQPCLLEFKTHNDKSFAKLKKDGVRFAKPEHYAQMQIYMKRMAIPVAMYGAVNKNDDDLHLELVHLDSVAADLYLERARKIIFATTPPEKIHDSTGWYDCKYCDKNTVCHLGEDPHMNCRTCHFVRVVEDGTFVCGNPFSENAKQALSEQQQLNACSVYEKF